MVKPKKSKKMSQGKQTAAVNTKTGSISSPEKTLSAGKATMASFIGFPLFFVLMAGFFALYGDRIWTLFKDREALRSWIVGAGVFGGAAFVLLQVLQVVIFVLPGEIVQVAGGFVFGFGQGLALTFVGIATGSMFNYAIGRWLGRPFVQALFPGDRLAGIENIISDRKAVAGYFLLFVIPGIPKDILCYVAGMTRYRFFLFLLVSMAGRLPGIAGSTFIGSSVYDGKIGVSIASFAVSSICFGIGLTFRDRITKWLATKLGRRGE